MLLLKVGSISAVVLILFAISLSSSKTPSAAAKAVVFPVRGNDKPMSDYRGISIGMTADAVRTTLGNPKDKSDATDFYIFSDSESAQFYYGAAKTVNAIMITFAGDLKDAPTPKAVFGEDAEAKSDGSISKLVRYPKAGYWISYNRTAPPDAIVNIAFQKI